MVVHAIDQQKFLANRKIIRYMYIAKGLSQQSSRVVKIAILTTVGEYIEYSCIFRRHFITPTVALRLKDLFSDYLLIHESEILVSNGLESDNPILLYLQFVRHHVNFLQTFKAPEDILRRICNYHKCITKQPLMKINQCYLNKVWNFILQRKRCPWITSMLDCQIKKIKKRYRQREVMMMRLGIYYMFVKKKYRDINMRAKQKKIAMQKTLVDS